MSEQVTEQLVSYTITRGGRIVAQDTVSASEYLRIRRLYSTDMGAGRNRYRFTCEAV